MAGYLPRAKTMRRLWIVFILSSFISAIGGINIVAVLDKAKGPSRSYMVRTLEKQQESIGMNINVILADQNDSIGALEAVCSSMKTGAVILLDMSPPSVGLLLRSFARTIGMPYITVMDESLLYTPDVTSELHLHVEPPGSVMLRVVSDIVTAENLTKVAILYDRSFNMDIIPRRILSGIPTQHLYQEVNLTSSKLQLARLNDMEIRNFFVICDRNIADSVLSEANAVNMLGEKYNWFVLTKGAKVTCAGCRKEMNVTTILASPSYEPRNKYVSFMKDVELYFNIENMHMDDALIYDLSNVIGEMLNKVGPLSELFIDDCYNTSEVTHSVLEQGYRINEMFRNVSLNGVYGKMQYRNGQLIQMVSLNLRRETFVEGNLNEVDQVGNWTDKQGLYVFGPSLFGSQTSKTYTVVVVPRSPPFVYTYKNSTTITVEGYCKDLLDLIANMLDFNYVLHLSPDNQVGSMYDDGSWNGVIKELIDKKADIAIGPISVMAERENVVDFTVPYYDLVGLTILMKKPKFEYSLIRFLTVLDEAVWGCIIGAFFLFSVLLSAFDRFSPFSFQNNKESWKGEGAEPRVFSMKEGIWFCMMSLTPQGGGEAPRAVSGRLIAATWWLFAFIIIATYTANLAAFLTVSRLETPIKSLDDLSKQFKVEYGPMNGTSALVYFKRMAEIEERFYSIWKRMSLNDSLDSVERAKLAVWDYPVSDKYTKLWEAMEQSGLPQSLDEAISRVLTSDFAYIGDATENKYQTLTNCELMSVGDEFSRKPFAFAVQEGSHLRNELSSAILELQNQRKLEELEEKWWISNEERLECPKIEQESDGISIKNIGGVFLVIAIGSVLALFTLAFEFYWYKYRPEREAKDYAMSSSTSQAPLTLNTSAISLPVSALPDITESNNRMATDKL
ncbi:hypothetical protein ScPMuIL_005814 [Solemya velum]